MAEEQLSQRQSRILAAIVKEYSDMGIPVASKELVEKYGFDVSGATVRNEMQILEKQGYITHPHTSAGRIPTDKGFRYFVNVLMEKVKLSIKEQERLRMEVFKLQAVNKEVGRRLAKLLSETTSQASFAIFPEATSTVGISNMLDNPQLPPEDAMEIAQFFDHIDEYADNLVNEYGEKAPEAYIGKEIKLSSKSEHSMVVGGVQLPDGKRGVIGLLGPKNMKYEKNLSILEYISKLLGGGGAAIILFHLIK